jgi:8-oxo-dGTP pyrophosphatase MutT (NUDIX family)
MSNQPHSPRTDHPIITLDSQAAWRCRWYGVRKDRIRLPDGSEGEYNVVELPDAVWVLPITEAGEVVLLYHYRYPLRRWGWELPSGSISPGDSPEATASRELQEEAGGSARAWRHLLTTSTVKGIGTEQAHLFLATGVTLGATDHEPAEVMSVHTLPPAEVLRMARAGEIDDAISVLAILLGMPG